MTRRRILCHRWAAGLGLRMEGVRNSSGGFHSKCHALQASVKCHGFGGLRLIGRSKRLLGLSGSSTLGCLSRMTHSISFTRRRLCKPSRVHLASQRGISTCLAPRRAKLHG